MSAGTHGRTQTPAHAGLEPGAERCRNNDHTERSRPPMRPPTDSGVAALTGIVVIRKLALNDPAATVTLDCTLPTVVVLLESVTMKPPVGAAVVNVTATLLIVPPPTLVRLTVTQV